MESPCSNVDLVVNNKVEHAIEEASKLHLDDEATTDEPSLLEIDDSKINTFRSGAAVFHSEQGQSDAERG